MAITLPDAAVKLVTALATIPGGSAVKPGAPNSDGIDTRVTIDGSPFVVRIFEEDDDYETLVQEEGL